MKYHQYHLLVKFAFEDELGQPSERVKAEVLQKYRDQLVGKPKDKSYPLSLFNPYKERMTLYDLLHRKTFRADLWCGPWFAVPGSTYVGEYSVHVTDIILNYHYDPIATRPITENYYVFGIQDKVYASHRTYKRPDYHHVVELASAPPGASPLLVEFGFEANLVAVTGGGIKNPLTEGHGYVIEFFAEGRKLVSSSMVVQKDVWFDNFFINEYHDPDMDHIPNPPYPDQPTHPGPDHPHHPHH